MRRTHKEKRVIAALLNHWKRAVRSLVWLAATLLWGTAAASAQQADELQQQLQQLKQQYEATTRELEQRIAALEQQIQKESENEKQREQAAAEEKKKNVSAVEVAAQQAARKALLGESDQVGAQFQGKLTSEPTYDLIQEADLQKEKPQEPAPFEFHGYFRSGYGLNGQGGQQVAFQAPGADAKYRLGNETETYAELIFVNNWLNPDRSSDKAWLKTETMIQANTTNSASYAAFPNGIGNDQLRFREAFVQAGHILDGQPGAKFWAGKRFYRFWQIDIDDFFPLNMSGYGGGVEDFNLGIGKLALAFLSGARPDITTQNGHLAKSNIDLRLYELHGPEGLWTGWFNFATSKGGTTSSGTTIPTTSGYAFGLRQQQLEWHGGFHSFSLQYGTGAASNFSTFVETPTAFLNSSARFLITEQVLAQPNDRFAIMPIFVYQRAKDGNPQHDWNEWVSFGARPVIFFNRYLSLAFEEGFDHTHNPGQYDGWLSKTTIAPQLGAGDKFFSRPVLRVFVTFANWSDGFRGYVGGTPYLNKTAGLTYGVQAETWW